MYCTVQIFDLSHREIGRLSRVASCQRSYVLNGIGQARVLTSATDPLWTSGVLDIGKLVVLTSDEGFEPWGGWIIRCEQSTVSLTITCKSLAYIFTKRRLGKSEFFPYATPSQLQKQLTALTGPFIVSDAGNIDTTAPFSKEFHFTGGAAALRRLPYDTGVDWWVSVGANGVGVLHTGNHGVDKSEFVLLAEGSNIQSDPAPTYTRDGEQLINDSVYVGRGDGAWESAPHAQKKDHASVTQWGLYEGTGVQYDTIHSSTLEEVARRTIERQKKPRELLEFYVANVNGVWSTFTIGDIVQVRIPSLGQSGINGPMRIVGLESDEFSSSPCRVMGEMV